MQSEDGEILDELGLKDRMISHKEAKQIREDIVRATEVQDKIKKYRAKKGKRGTPKLIRNSAKSAMESAQLRKDSPIQEILCLAMNEDDDLHARFVTEYPIGPYRLDFAFLGVRLCVEADGYWWHRAEPAQIMRDQKRDRYLSQLGWITIRLTGKEIRNDIRSCVQRVRETFKTLSR